VLQETGVQFINTGLVSTLAGLTQYNTAYTKMTQAVVNSTRTINNSLNTVTNNSSKSFSLIGSVVNNFSNSLSNSTAGVSRFGMGLKQLILTMTGFIFLKRVINDLFDSLRSLWDTMITGASNTELLTIRFRNLVAISIQNTQGIDDYATALTMALNPAKDLLDWVNVVAVKTIFSRDEVATVLSLGMAFDMTAGQSKTLTKAMIDWASGMGLQDDALQRMVVNFGQMLRMGKITQRELRDLAIGGLFPVNEALRRIGERAGLTGKALSDFMTKTATSGLPVNALLTEFVAIAGERFPDAGERMAKTWKGVTQNIKDFVTTIMGAALLGPTMNKIVGSLSDLLDQALSPAVRGAATELGERLATSLEKVWGAMKNVAGAMSNLARAFGIPIPSIYEVVAAVEVFVNYISEGLNDAADAVNSWLTTTGSTFSKGAQEFLQWGLEMVTQFAIGIIQGATTALVAAMNIISSVLAFFLGPGSPPRVAPDIDIWGESAMNEFLKGMTKADFDILKDLQGPLQSALNVMAALGLIAKDQVGQIFYNLSKQIIAAMHQFEKTGKVSEALFASIHKAGGAMGDELEKLARLQFALLAATKALERAQKELNDARTADKTAASRVDALTKEYRDLVDAGASKDILEAKRAEIKAAMDERDQTKENIALAEDKVKTAEDVLAPLKEQVALQEQLIAQMIALAQAQVDAAEGAGGGIENVFKNMGDSLAEFNENMEVTKVKMAIAQVEFENKIDAMSRRMSVKLGEIFAPIVEQWNKEITPSITRITNSFNRMSDNIEKIFNKVSGKGSGAENFIKVLGKIVGYILGFRVVIGIIKWIFSPLAGIFATVAKHGATIGGILKTIIAIGGAVVAFISSLSLFTIAVIAAVVVAIVYIISRWDVLKEQWQAFVDMLGAFGNSLSRWMVTALDKIQKFFDGVPGEISKIGPAIGTALNNVITSLGEFLGNVKTWFENVLKKVGEGLSPIGEAWNNFWKGIKQFATDIFEGAEGIWAKIIGWLAGVWNAIVIFMADTLGETGIGQFIKDFVKAGEDLIMGLVQGVINKAQEFKDTIVNAVKDAWNGVINFLDMRSPSHLFAKVGKNIMAGMTQGITDGTQGAVNAMIGAASKISMASSISVNAAQTGRNYQPATVAASPIYNTRSSNKVTNYNLSMATAKSTGNVQTDFAIMETLAG